MTLAAMTAAFYSFPRPVHSENKDMATRALSPLPILSPEVESGLAYDAVGPDYRSYADGDHKNLFDFSSRYSFADREIWLRINSSLREMRARGQKNITIVDAGCGPGTWLIRVVSRALDLGFEKVVAHGFDISREMILLARHEALSIDDDRVTLRFDMLDIEKGLADYLTKPADMVICLYGVLNHLPQHRHDDVARALSLAAGCALFVTVRMVGSIPSIFVTGVEEARHFHRDHEHDRLSIEFHDGRHIEFCSHLFSAAEFCDLFAQHGRVREMAGLDLFHGRFKMDDRWNPRLPADKAFDDALVQLEHLCASDARFIDHAAHALLHLETPRRKI